MTLRTIAHALLTWSENGRAHTAFHGDLVDLPDDVIARFERFGAFESEAVVALKATVEEPVESTTAVTPAVAETVAEQPALDPVTKPEPAQVITVEQPKFTATKAAWAEYATARGIAVDELDKNQIIFAVNQLDELENQS
ncbi:hypothetical protein R4P64_03395 [Rhodococcus sp. IEGM 1366]|uniref:hypothetical protein n=1 Tax=Rhodococcus sp. IEGM 1366 TaxID=3082223 RepID=UPI002954AD98|nr:hypothetical protein [Rhodococcus sp. IEGM 1366]MDV8065543.1 hypothetical protein [Rhodococcus sp. IEGM 1366]